MTLLTQTIVNNKEEDHLCNNVKFQIVFIQKKSNIVVSKKSISHVF